MDWRVGDLHGRGFHPEGDALDGRDQHLVHQGDQEQVHWRRSRVWLHQLHQRQRGPHLYAQTKWKNNSRNPTSCQVRPLN